MIVCQYSIYSASNSAKMQNVLPINKCTHKNSSGIAAYLMFECTLPIMFKYPSVWLCFISQKLKRRILSSQTGMYT
jgi:hypothetical protein